VSHVRYRIRHLTRYAYGGEVVHSHQLLHLLPRESPYQQCLTHSLDVAPLPSMRADVHDAFGNPITRLELDRPHDSLAVTSDLEVDVIERPDWRAEDSAPWESVREALCYTALPLETSQLEARRFRCESPHVRIKHRLQEYAAGCLKPQRPILAAAEALMHQIHDEFTYAPGETEVGIPLMQLLEQRRGVCQDFAHFMIACLRSSGLAARYVSGYLRTLPVELPGAATSLVGSEASHAWVSVYAPPLGWVDLDPTNDLRVGLDHVALAWGRDFGDVSPLRGVILGGGSHHLSVSVSMAPVT
jgi:transglutaminase-like putative cysteine protease